MTKNENEIKNLSSQDKEKLSSQPKSQKNTTKKDVKPVEETTKQKKKQEKKKPANKKEVAETSTISQKANAPDEPLKNSTSEKKEQEQEKKIVKDLKMGTSSTRKSSIAKLSDKNTLPINVEPPKTSKKVKTPVSTESLSQSKDVKSASTKEESSNIIINYFQQISEDLRAIRNFLIPEKVPMQKNEKKPEKKIREKVEPNETVNPMKKVKLSNEENEIKKEKTSKPKIPTSAGNKPKEEEIVPGKKDLDDSFIISKLKNKFDNGIVFSNKEARNIWLGSQGRYNMDQWNTILKNLCKKKKIIEVDNNGERIHYKLSD